MRAAVLAIVLIGMGGAASAQPATGGSSSGQAVASSAEMRELLDAARATAKATRESVDYSRVVPDLLTQMLNKLDKIEDKLDRIDTTLKASGKRR